MPKCDIVFYMVVCALDVMAGTVDESSYGFSSSNSMLFVLKVHMILLKVLCTISSTSFARGFLALMEFHVIQ